MPISDAEALDIAGRILATGDAGGSIAPITEAVPDFNLQDAYRVSDLITARRSARGERPVGWKIGFTNRTIWDEYGVHAPIWGPMYSSTLAEVRASAGPFACPVGHLAEPRIEPEIALRIAATPDSSMGEEELLACIDGVAHGIEVVQSIFPGWKFRAADTVAAFALHGCYRHGPFRPVEAGDRRQWLEGLGGFEIALSRDGRHVDTGAASHVLGGGPLTALRHLVQALPRSGGQGTLKPGDIVTTGTVTRAFPIASGERWSTEIRGLPLPGLTVDFV